MCFGCIFEGFCVPKLMNFSLWVMMENFVCWTGISCLFYAGNLMCILLKICMCFGCIFEGFCVPELMDFSLWVMMENCVCWTGISCLVYTGNWCALCWEFHVCFRLHFFKGFGVPKLMVSVYELWWKLCVCCIRNSCVLYA